MEPLKAVRLKAMDLLARREHSTKELTQKLLAKGFETELVQTTCEQLCADGLLSDDRFTEHFVRYRYSRGVGPLKIEKELSEKGVDREGIQKHLEAFDWAGSLRTVLHKKFGDNLSQADPKTQQKQLRFIFQRGFSQSQYFDVMNEIE